MPLAFATALFQMIPIAKWTSAFSRSPFFHNIFKNNIPQAMKIYFTGKKTYDSDGKSNSDSCWIGWKLYDEEGYVVKSGTAFTQDVCEGEGFKRYEETIWSLEKGTYRLELTSVN